MLLALLAAGLLAGCSGTAASSATPTGGASEATPRLTAMLHQTRLDVAPGIVQVLTGNDGTGSVTLTALAIDWPGFPAPAAADLTKRFPPEGYPLAPDLQADLPVKVPTTVCGAAEAPTEPPVVEFVADGQDVDVTVTDPDSLAMMQRLWRESCARQQISDVATVVLGDDWTESTVGGTAALRGTLVLTRNGERGPRVSVTDVGGSVLIEQVAVDDGRTPLLTLRRDAPSAALPVDLLTTGRCDPHGLSESTTTFVLSANLQLEDGMPVTFLVSPPDAVRDRILDTIYAGCGVAAPPGG